MKPFLPIDTIEMTISINNHNGKAIKRILKSELHYLGICKDRPVFQWEIRLQTSNEKRVLKIEANNFITRNRTDAIDYHKTLIKRTAQMIIQTFE